MSTPAQEAAEAIDLDALAAKISQRILSPTAEPVGDYEIVSHSIIDDAFAVLVKTPSKKHYVGRVIGWTEVPDPKA